MGDRAPARTRSLSLLAFAVVVVLVLLDTLLARWASADEFLITPDSTVVGRSFGYPDGTPSQGLPPEDELEFVAETTVFFKNLELFGIDPIEGQTYIGFLFPLRFRYRADPRLSFELGAVLGHNFGDDNDLDVAEPLVRLVWEPIDGVFFVPGTIFPTHWIHDAILDDVQRFRQNAEQGFQLRVDREHLKLDQWINWRVREGKVRSEKFEVGNSTQLRLFDGRLWLDGQVLWDHTGGQVSLSDEVDHNIVTMGGASLGFPEPFGCSCIEEVRFGGGYFYSYDDRKNFSTLEGSAWESWARVDVRIVDWLFVRLFGGYFDGDDLLPGRGDPLYSLDDYGQVGLTTIVSLTRDLRVESGIVMQQTDGRTNFTYQFHFSWGQAFSIPLHARKRPGET